MYCRADESSSLGHFAFHIFGPEGVFERMVRMEVAMPDLYYWVRAGSYGAHPADDGAAIFSDGIRKIMRTDLSRDEAGVETFVQAWVPPERKRSPGVRPMC